MVMGDTEMQTICGNEGDWFVLSISITNIHISIRLFIFFEFRSQK